MSASGLRGTSTAPPTLSVVLATLNEYRNLPEVVRRIRQLPLPACEIVVVDDGSTDGTRQYLEILAREDPRVRLLFHEGRQTTLRAQCQGIEAAAGSVVVVMDADLQHPPEILPALLRELQSGASLAIASRYAPGGSAGPRTLGRIVISRGAELTAKVLLAPARRVTDPVSGYFAFDRSLWYPLNPQYRGYKLLLFLLVMTEGRRVAEVGFEFEPRTDGSSKVAQGLAFVRLFLIEVILARRLQRVLRKRVRLLPGPAETTPR
jgi:dolichol-phosphate mannosyltransferase